MDSGDDNTLELSAYLQGKRRQILDSAIPGFLDKPDLPEGNPLLMGENHLSNGVICLVVGLDGFGRRFLIRARAAIKVVFEAGVRPYRGANPIGCLKDNDDEELDHHWALAHQCQYLVDVLLDQPDENDLRSIVRRLRHLIDKTSGLSGDIKVSRFDILALYLWASSLLRDCGEALASAEPHCGKAVTPKTKIRSYGPESAYLRMLCIVGRFLSGQDAFRDTAAECLRSLFALHRDYERVRETERLWPGVGYDFRWAWLWEVLFCQEPDPGHAIRILRGMDPVTGAMPESIETRQEENTAGGVRAKDPLACGVLGLVCETQARQETLLTSPPIADGHLEGAIHTKGRTKAEFTFGQGRYAADTSPDDR